MQLVKFGAAWCAPCHKMAPVLALVADKHPNLVVTDVDIDETDGEVLKEWAVTGVPSMYLFADDGRLLDQFYGAYPPATLLARIEKFQLS